MTIRRTLFLTLAAALLFTSCAAAIPNPADPTNGNNADPGDIPSPAARSIAAAEKEPTGADPDTAFRDAVTAFSETLYQLVNKQEENNLVLSPLSVIYALSLCANGASGETLTEFEALNSGIAIEDMNEYLYTLTLALENTKESKVNVANSAWANRDSFTLSDDFVTVAQKYYNAEAHSLPFADPATLTTINQWVSDKTDGMIPEMLSDLDPAMVLVLLNTVLFDGIWEEEYDEGDVSEAIFTAEDGTESTVDFLYSEENTFFTVDGGKGFSKAYKDGYSFTAVLPDEGMSIDEFVASLDLSALLEAAKSGDEEVRVAIPKFEYDCRIELGDRMQEMGLRLPFSGEAELGGLQESGMNNLAISQIFQKAKIILNEHGTKAAAATGILIMKTAAPVRKEEVFLNRPFLYVITNADNVPLFLGTVRNPGE